MLVAGGSLEGCATHEILQRFIRLLRRGLKSGDFGFAEDDIDCGHTS
jgi:hypothetical protein